MLKLPIKGLPNSDKHEAGNISSGSLNSKWLCHKFQVPRISWLNIDYPSINNYIISNQKEATMYKKKHELSKFFKTTASFEKLLYLKTTWHLL